MTLRARFWLLSVAMLASVSFMKRSATLLQGLKEGAPGRANEKLKKKKKKSCKSQAISCNFRVKWPSASSHSSASSIGRPTSAGGALRLRNKYSAPDLPVCACTSAMLRGTAAGVLL